MKKRNLVLILLTALGVITFIDRINISVASDNIMTDLGLNEAQWGWVLSAFILSYSLFQIPLGNWGDRKGQRLVLTFIVMWWSVFTGMTGAAGGFMSLVAIRFMFGIGEAGAYPNMTSAIGKWFPKRETGKAQGFIWAASRFGGALAPITVIPLMAWVGWRMTFAIFGVVGLLWGVVWLVWYKDNPQQMKGISAKERSEVNIKTASDSNEKTPWKQITESS